MLSASLDVFALNVLYVRGSLGPLVSRLGVDSSALFIINSHWLFFTMVDDQF